MANKFNDIDESKIIKKKSNESKEEVKEKVQQVKVQAKVQAKVQTKVTVKPEEKVTKVNVTPRVEAKKVEVKPENVQTKPENIQVKQEEKIVVKQEDKVVAKPVEHKKMVEDKVVVSEPIIKKENKVEPQIAKTAGKVETQIAKTAAKVETKNKEINVSEKIEKKSSFPVFNVDPVTKSTTPVSNFNYNSQKKKTMNLNVPTDQLKRIKYDTEKCINEITLDIIILNNLINKNDEYCDYYKNKLANLKNELNFYKQKKLTIQALLK